MKKSEVIEKLEDEFYQKDKKLDDLNSDILLHQPWCFNQDHLESYLAGYVKALEFSLTSLDKKFPERLQKKRQEDLVKEILEIRKAQK